MQQSNTHANDPASSISKADLHQTLPTLAIERLDPSSLDWLESQQAARIHGGTAISDRESLSKIPSLPPHSALNAWPNELPHWSASLQNLLDQPPSSLPARLFLGGLLFSAAFGAWTWLGQVQEVSTAQGHLIPKGEVYRVQSTVQGEVTHLRVAEGQTVFAGEVIAELDSRLAETEVERLQESLAAHRLQVIQIEALIDRTRLELGTRQAIAAAEAQAQEAAIAQARNNAATHREVLAQLQVDAAAYMTRLNRLQPLVEEGAIAADHLFEVEQALRDRQQLMTQRSGELQQTLSDADRLQAGLEQKQAEGQRSQLEAQQRLQQLEIEMSQLQAKLTETQNLLKAAQTQRDQMFLYAPANGVISFLQVRRRGEILQPGQTFAEVAPQDAPLVVSATLPTREAGFVKVGMPAKLKFDTFPYQDYGIVSGEVVSISPDTVLDERAGAVYRLEIALDLEAIHQRHPTLEFKAGQTTTAEIVIRQRRIIDVILDPIRQLKASGINL